ncbi:sensor histidine kinase [Marivita cryptomonadis]|uniref:histidine kinase n=1 Tax=Marivita cryptomonadis TaxID=505252 RepID=A0A9Q2S1F0_9RHOB|nr:sensor histidine kinase [Marivita cryptomonadis]MCR9169048.1 sensor histidine kinase [Paracoccaceae bacterium]MBM2332971.1 sensor histidine kinase [Marivita cryptomonadis]MBM2347219.1 sensor histidine kinase [Marivita cryptomonadis]MBM2351902.1 sensor histidine kinase [Marivita cryptomonadis]MBM2371076.1 sensor histidine kinase [Marivita cryptomonadis]
MQTPNTDNAVSQGRESGVKALSQKLVVRIAFLLSLALLPIGLVAMGQSWRALHITNDNLEASIHARTAALVAPERQALFSKIGTASALADTMGAAELSITDCTAIMQRVQESNPRLAFAGLLEPGSVSNCNSIGRRFEFLPDARSDALFANPEPYITFNPQGSASELPVIIVAYPTFSSDDVLKGFVTISFETEPLLQSDTATGPNRDVALLTFNKFGDTLSSFTPDGPITDYLPSGLAFDGFVNQGDTFFTATTQTGETRLISVVPILPGEVYALGSWGRAELQRTSAPWFTISTLLFPFLMWLVGIIVAVVSLNRLVLRHISDLGRRMRRFATYRDVETSEKIDDAPSEILTINETFEGMADQLLRDEADLENAVFEREVLLKEVHHRVKNNLQLISSIINMQVRQVASPEAVAALRQFQDRVTSLASVHRALYQEPSLTHIRFDVLLGDLVSQVNAVGSAQYRPVEIDLVLDPVTLLPDQTSPLAMVTTEALSNAFKYGGPGPDGVFRLKVHLKETTEGGTTHVRLVIENSVEAETSADSGSGLGKRLILAFASQLDADLQETETDDRYMLSISFEYQPFTPD